MLRWTAIKQYLLKWIMFSSIVRKMLSWTKCYAFAPFLLFNPPDSSLKSLVRIKSVTPTAEMVLSEIRTSMVIAGRGARACDMCGKERARWYCAADEAYLCERCDGSVHSANAVAKRHERVRLGPNGAPVKLKPSHHHSRKIKLNEPPTLNESNVSPSDVRKGDVQKWNYTSRKRSRTTRRGANTSGQSLFNPTPTVNLESCSSTIINEENNETNLLLYDLLTNDNQLGGDFSETAPVEMKSEPFSPPSSTLTSRDFLDVKVEESGFTHEVPTYEPLLEDLIDSTHEDFMEKLMPSSPSPCNVSCGSGASTSTTLELNTTADARCKEVKLETAPLDGDAEALHMYDLVDSSAGDINEGVTISEDSDIDTFDVMDLCSNANFDDNLKADELKEEFPDMEMWKSAYRLDQGSCASVFEGNPFKAKGERDLEIGCMDTDSLQEENVEPLQQCPQKPSLKRPLSLHLDYEDVINSWSDRGSLWMDGQRPQIVPDVNFLDHGFTECGMVMVAESSCNNSMCSQAGQVPSLVVVDKGREARVLRYKEKRRTRLFSKRIRYEVRKLNAERRPRMKGRFVKRAAIAALAAISRREQQKQGNSLVHMYEGKLLASLVFSPSLVSVVKSATSPFFVLLRKDLWIRPFLCCIPGGRGLSTPVGVV
ncbi:hypothetical protein GOP47_0007437 [Adiantum capillus-veneris]|uniref:Uncharacterized protein n=1 Tax=Adiantum capillus-veneris TaxID=13818 RepID=A0A9D4V1J8_ADICA|nr:hypothetical protein GOP47_0007437 [Adiantum capillus-veneris]